MDVCLNPYRSRGIHTTWNCYSIYNTLSTHYNIGITLCAPRQCEPEACTVGGMLTIWTPIWATQMRKLPTFGEIVYYWRPYEYVGRNMVSITIMNIQLEFLCVRTVCTILSILCIT